MTTVPRLRSSEPARTRWWLGLGAILVIATALRLCNLGTFSLWLDEAFTMRRATLPFPELVAAALADPDNAPLYLVVTRLSLLSGLVEPWLRLVPIAAGLISIAVWTAWTRSLFGGRVALLTGSFMALSTFHIRYSQELRAYPYLLLVTGVAMVAAERLRSRPSPGTAAALAGTVAVGWYTHFSFAMILIPVAGLVLALDRESSPERVTRRRRAAVLAASIVLGTLAVVPWLVAIARALPDRLSRGATTWSLVTVGRRWEFLTVAAQDSSTLSWLGVVLAAPAVIGLIAAFGRRAGRTVVIPAAAAIVGLELLFLVVNRWSKPRYATAVWPFLVVLVALGLDRLLQRLGWRWLGGIAGIGLAVAMVIRADSYHRLGRPHWDRMASAIESVRRPQEPVLTESEWIATCLPLYYFGEIRSLRWSTRDLLTVVEGSPSALLVTSTHHADNPELRRLARSGALLAAIPSTGELVRLRPDLVRPDSNGTAWPDPAAELVDEELEREPTGCLGRFMPPTASPREPLHDTGRIDLGETAEDRLRSGFTGVRRRADGSEFRWVTSREAALVVRRSRETTARLSVRVRPFRGKADQRLRLLVNGSQLGTTVLEPGPHTVSFRAPGAVWTPGRNLVVIQFSRVIPVGEGSLPKAAAVDWIELAPLSE